MPNPIYRGMPLLFLLIFLFVYAGVAQGKDEESRAAEPLNFTASLDLAFKHNPGVIEARKLIEASQGDLITTRTLQNPEAELEFGGFKKDVNGERNVNLDSVEIRQPFDPLGTRYLQSRMASNQVKIQKEEFKSVWSSVYIEVRQTYSQIILRKKELELTGDNLNTMRQFFSRVQIRYQSGQALKNDFQRAKIELIKAENDYLLSQKELRTDKAKLNLLLGRSMDVEFDIEEDLREDELQVTFEELKRIALENRPDIKIAGLELDNRQKNLAKEQLNRLPSYFIGFKRTDESDKDDYAVLVGVSLPLWNLNQGEVKKAKAQKEAQLVRTEAVKNEAVFNVYDAYLTVELNQKQLELFRKSLEEANELLRLANLRYGEGKIDFLNYLDQVRTATQAKVNYYKALFDLGFSVTQLESSIYSSLRQEEFLK